MVGNQWGKSEEYMGNINNGEQIVNKRGIYGQYEMREIYGEWVGNIWEISEWRVCGEWVGYNNL